VLDFDPLMEEDDGYVQSKVEKDKDVMEAVAGEEEASVDTTDDEYDTADVDDGYIDLSHALLRHKRVSLAYLDELAAETYEAMQRGQMEMEFGGYDGGDNFWDEIELEDEPPPKKSKPKQLPNYRTSQQVQVIQNPSKLKNFCDTLTKSVEKSFAAHDNDPNASAIGFDVEYCSLELDIRGTLPAMLQLAGPTKESPIGLIWLDKFPDHGRNMIGKSEYEPLLRILADPKILKVGVGASKDAKHLLSWWGVNDRKHSHYFVGGMTDLEGVDVDCEEKSLSEMCLAVLSKRLPKSKQKMTKKQKQRKKKGRSTPTAHWRTTNITKQMKEYAANDVACGIEVWMKLKGLTKE